MHITVIGCGRWGSLIAWYLDRTGHRVTLYGRPGSRHMQRFLATRQNDLLTLPESGPRRRRTAPLASSRESMVMTVCFSQPVSSRRAAVSCVMVCGAVSQRRCISFHSASVRLQDTGHSSFRYTAVYLSEASIAERYTVVNQVLRGNGLLLFPCFGNSA